MKEVKHFSIEERGLPVLNVLHDIIEDPQAAGRKSLSCFKKRFCNNNNSNINYY